MFHWLIHSTFWLLAHVAGLFIWPPRLGSNEWANSNNTTALLCHRVGLPFPPQMLPDSSVSCYQLIVKLSMLLVPWLRWVHTQSILNTHAYEIVRKSNKAPHARAPNRSEFWLKRQHSSINIVPGCPAKRMLFLPLFRNKKRLCLGNIFNILQSIHETISLILKLYKSKNLTCLFFQFISNTPHTKYQPYYGIQSIL